MNPTNYGGTPGYGQKFTQTFTEVLASTAGQIRMPGGVMLALGNGIVAKGTVLGKVTASSLYVPYSAAAADGSQVPICILDNDTDTTTSNIGASAWIAGVFVSAALTGLDANAKTAQTMRLCYFV